MAVIDAELLVAVTDFLLEEADCIDQRRWHDWLALYEPDCVFWVPAWDDDDVLTSDPDGELSLIYLDDHDRMAERIWRIESGQSASLARMPRLCHLVSNIRVQSDAGDTLFITANFQTDAFKHEEKRVDFFFGRYEYQLRRREPGFGIVLKKAIIYNDIIPRQLDIFSV